MPGPRQVVDRYVEIATADGKAALAELFAPDGVFHAPDGSVYRGREQIAAFLRPALGLGGANVPHSPRRGSRIGIAGRSWPTRPLMPPCSCPAITSPWTTTASSPAWRFSFGRAAVTKSEAEAAHDGRCHVLDGNSLSTVPRGRAGPRLGSISQIACQESLYQHERYLSGFDRIDEDRVAGAPTYHDAVAFQRAGRDLRARGRPAPGHDSGRGRARCPSTAHSSPGVRRNRASTQSGAARHTTGWSGSAWASRDVSTRPNSSAEVVCPLARIRYESTDEGMGEHVEHRLLRMRRHWCADSRILGDREVRPFEQEATGLAWIREAEAGRWAHPDFDPAVREVFDRCVEVLDLEGARVHTRADALQEARLLHAPQR